MKKPKQNRLKELSTRHNLRQLEKVNT